MAKFGPQFDDHRWDMEHAVRVLKEAEGINSDPAKMAEIERFITEEREDLEKVQSILFGGSSDDTD